MSWKNNLVAMCRKHWADVGCGAKVKPEGAKPVLKLPHTQESRRRWRSYQGKGSFNTNWKRKDNKKDIGPINKNDRTCSLPTDATDILWHLLLTKKNYSKLCLFLSITDKLAIMNKLSRVVFSCTLKKYLCKTWVCYETQCIWKERSLDKIPSCVYSIY